ncbi:hypothetical protein ACN47E_008956 [Coniothyrium glycines]
MSLNSDIPKSVARAWWSNALQKHAGHDPTSPHTPVVPVDHIPLSKAGSGCFGSVFFCVPEHEVALATVPEDLSQAVVAVKVTAQGGQATAADELKMLKYLEVQTPRFPSAEELFSKLLDWDASKLSGPSWIITSTWPVCTALTNLTGLFSSLPEEFLWVVYIQMHRALDFLHDICDPPLAHGDIHTGNMLIGYSDLDCSGLPKIRVIDFGFARLHLPNSIKHASHANLDRVRRDVYMTLEVLDSIAHEPTAKGLSRRPIDYAASSREPSPSDKSQEFHDFHSALKNGLLSRINLPLNLRRDLWHKFGEYATRSLAAVSDDSTAKIRAVIQEVTKPIVLENHQRMHELLQQSA